MEGISQMLFQLQIWLLFCKIISLHKRAISLFYVNYVYDVEKTTLGGGACDIDDSECKNGGWCARQLSTGRTFCHCPPEYAGTLCENQIPQSQINRFLNRNLGIFSVTEHAIW